jgi:hypothetical protein
LNDQRIDYGKTTNSIGQITLKLLKSGEELLFDVEDRTEKDNNSIVSPNISRLVAIGKR